MKRIIKVGSPKSYSDWVKNMRGKNNEDYRHLQNPEKGHLHDTLLAEQGNLCGYTMKRITKTTSHIEHIKPESLCRDEKRGSDLDYNNLIACFPREGMSSKCRFGAQKKDNWWESDGSQFVSPLSQNCEALFFFKINGEIKANSNNARAKKTIDVLKLNDKTLTEDRKNAIEEFIYGEHNDPLSKGSAERSIEIIRKRLADGSFVEFCIPIEHGLKEYLVLLEKISKKRKYSTANKNKPKRK